MDTNVLVYAHLPGLEGHETVRGFLLNQLERPADCLVVTPLVLHEFLHVVTDPKRFDPPVPMSEAIAIARGYLGRSNVDCVPSDEAALDRALDLLDRHRLGRRRIADTLLAATLLEAGCRELITCNPADFAVFDELVVIDPRVPSR